MIDPIPFVVPRYNDGGKLHRLLESLEQNTYPTHGYIRINDAGDNVYVTGAWNEGLIRAFKAEAKYCILLTQDLVLEKHCVQNLVHFMDMHERCGIAGVMQLSSENPDIITHGGCTIAYPNGHHLIGSLSAGHLQVATRQPWVNGSMMMMRMDAVREFGLFDKHMKLCGIDSDICYTARSRDWEVWYCPEAVTLADQGISRGAASPEVMQVMCEDMTYWGRKWCGTQLYQELVREFMTAEDCHMMMGGTTADERNWNPKVTVPESTPEALGK